MPHRRRSHARPKIALALLALAFLALLRPSDAAPPDLAARGLDLFVHAPGEAAPGGVLPVALEAVGFTSVVTPVHLGGALVEAVWNPETLGKGASLPPAVRATADAEGRAHLDVPVPDGDEGELELWLGVRSGAHARVRKLAVRRGRVLVTSIVVPDTRVVPGSSVSAWVVVRGASTGAPVAGVPVHVALLEGGVPRFSARLVTDVAGDVMARVPIPRSDDPAWKWSLEATALAGPGHVGSSAAVTLVPREETPGKPSLRARWEETSAFPGDRAAFVARVRDAAGQPVAELPIHYWIGQKPLKPPALDDAEGWKAYTHGRTDLAGEIHGAADMPTTVPKGSGTEMELVVVTTVEGHQLQDGGKVRVGEGTAAAQLFPEAREIVPGMTQRVLLRVLDGRGRPIAAPFLVEGDGLREEVRTDAFGEAELSWKAPRDVGATRNVGPCAGGVAASVRVRATADVPQILPRRDPFELCVPIDREAAGIARADRSAARVGETVHLTVAPAEPSSEAHEKAAARPKGPWSVVARSANGAVATGAWMEDGEKGVDLLLPVGLTGPWSISAAMPGTKRAARMLGTSLLVTDRVLPRIEARVAGGRAVPGGEVDVDVALADEKGRPLAGSIAAVMVDAHGGGSTAALESFDTRRTLCAPFQVPRERCDALVEGDAALDLVRRAALAARAQKPFAPANDPGGDLKAVLREAFASVLLSLEGAVRQASTSPDRLRDVRRRVGASWQWNPELMTLVTAAMKEPPETPGGEPFGLADLIAIDPQVTFDTVARRISRAKLFHVLVEVRGFRHQHALDPDEPVLANPNAILRRLVREGRLAEQDLVDPWGGTIQFTKSAGPALPFLTAVKGFELHAPGPDGALGSADDVRDPFERVVKSGTPYAEAVLEDRVVDAKLDMEVGDATVSAWQTLFDNLWGRELGESFGAGGLGLSGVGEGGGGRGEGIGHGSGFGSGHGRGTFGIADGVAFWSPPQRTDASGKLRLHVPLGDVETTWRLALVGLPDDGPAATTAIEIPSSLPVSARVDAGAAWVEGDEAAVSITVRNRQAHAINAALAITAGGAAALAEPTGTSPVLTRALSVPAEGAAVVRAQIKTPRAGTAELAVRLAASGAQEDLVTHRWEVRAPGEPTDFTSSRWIDGEAELALTMPPASIRLTGGPRLVVERGFEHALAGALESLDPDTLTSPRSLADAVEVASRLQRWATARGGEKDPLAERAAAAARYAVGRLAAYAAIDAKSAAIPRARAIPFAPSDVAAILGKAADCPAVGDVIDDRLEAIEAEPEAANGTAKPCWDAYVTNVAEAVQTSGDPEELARLFLAVVERGHRQLLAAALADRLRAALALKPSGALRLADDKAARRATRALLFAALLRALHLGGPSAADAPTLVAWLGVQRDAEGGYGSSLATRAVVRALLAEGATGNVPTHVALSAPGLSRTLEVPPLARLVVPLPLDTTRVTVRVTGPGVVARFERPVLRLWSSPPSDAQSPLHVELLWPEHPKAGEPGTLRVILRHTVGRAITADVTVPLPPGVTLAEAVDGVRQVQGVLTLRQALDAGELPRVIEIPLRFALPGRLWVPEARARVAFEDYGRAIAPARPVLVE